MNENRIEKIVLKIIKAIQYFAVFGIGVSFTLTVEYVIDIVFVGMFIVSILIIITVYMTNKRIQENCI